MSRTTCAVVFFSLMCSAAIADPIEVRLQAALKRYDHDIKKANKARVELLEKARRSAQKSGDLEKYELLSEQLKAFEANGDTPDFTSVSLDRQVNRANDTIERAYKSAISGYTKAGNIDAAQAINREFEKFKEHGRNKPLPFIRRGAVYSGKRSAWPKGNPPFFLAIKELDNGNFLGEIKRQIGTPTGLQMIVLPVSGSINADSIEFNAKGVPQTPFEKIRTSYTGKVDKQKITLTYKGVGKSGRTPVSGTAELQATAP